MPDTLRRFVNRRCATLFAVLILRMACCGTAYAQPVAEAVPAPMQLVDRPIGQLGVDITISDGETPTDRSAAGGEDVSVQLAAATRAWPVVARPWTPACTAHRPLYFEEVNAERLGYAYAPCLQPAVSAAHFFGSAVALPYRMAAEPPCECVYTLGHYRPGDCAPYRAPGWPASLSGVSWQTATVIGLVALVP